MVPARKPRGPCSPCVLASQLLCWRTPTCRLSGGGSAAPETSLFSVGLSEGCGAGGNGGCLHKTPATHLKGILKKPVSAGPAGHRGTPGSTVKFNLGSSGAKLAGNRSAKQVSLAPLLLAVFVVVLMLLWPLFVVPAVCAVLQGKRLCEPCAVAMQ